MMNNNHNNLNYPSYYQSPDDNLREENSVDNFSNIDNGRHSSQHPGMATYPSSGGFNPEFPNQTSPLHNDGGNLNVPQLPSGPGHSQHFFPTDQRHAMNPAMSQNSMMMLGQQFSPQSLFGNQFMTNPDARGMSQGDHHDHSNFEEGEQRPHMMNQPMHLSMNQSMGQQMGQQIGQQMGQQMGHSTEHHQMNTNQDMYQPIRLQHNMNQAMGVRSQHNMRHAMGQQLNHEVKQESQNLNRQMGQQQNTNHQTGQQHNVIHQQMGQRNNIMNQPIGQPMNFPMDQTQQPGNNPMFQQQFGQFYQSAFQHPALTSQRDTAEITPDRMNFRQNTMSNVPSHMGPQFFPFQDQNPSRKRKMREESHIGVSVSTSSEEGEKQQVENPEIICRCVKSRCLKLYCDCFQTGLLCNTMCKCLKCLNTEVENKKGGRLKKARRDYMLRRPGVFGKKPKKTEDYCACKNNRCLKKYCYCFRNNISCTEKCYCVNCANQYTHKPKGSPDKVATSERAFGKAYTEESPESKQSVAEKSEVEESPASVESLSIPTEVHPKKSALDDASSLSGEKQKGKDSVTDDVQSKH